MLLLLMLIVALLVFGTLPVWGYSFRWGYMPSSGLGLLLAVLAVLILAGQI